MHGQSFRLVALLWIDFPMIYFEWALDKNALEVIELTALQR